MASAYASAYSTSFSSEGSICKFALIKAFILSSESSGCSLSPVPMVNASTSFLFQRRCLPACCPFGLPPPSAGKTRFVVRCRPKPNIPSAFLAPPTLRRLWRVCSRGSWWRCQAYAHGRCILSRRLSLLFQILCS